MSKKLPNALRITFLAFAYTVALIVATYAWGDLATTSAHSFDQQINQYLLPSGANYPTLDPGTLDSMSDSESRAISAQAESVRAYPSPSRRGYPAPEPFATLQLRPNEEGRLHISYNEVTVTIIFPPGTTDQEAQVQLFQLTHLLSQIEARLVGIPFTIQSSTLDGTPIDTFNKPYTVVLSYKNTRLQDGDEEVLMLYQWDQLQNDWVPVEMGINMDEDEITAIIGQPTELILLGRSHLFLPAIQQ